MAEVSWREENGVIYFGPSTDLNGDRDANESVAAIAAVWGLSEAFVEDERYEKEVITIMSKEAAMNRIGTVVLTMLFSLYLLFLLPLPWTILLICAILIIELQIFILRDLRLLKKRPPYRIRRPRTETTAPPPAQRTKRTERRPTGTQQPPAARWAAGDGRTTPHKGGILWNKTLKSAHGPDP